MKISRYFLFIFRAQVKQMEAALRVAQVNLAHTTITALLRQRHRRGPDKEVKENDFSLRNYVNPAQPVSPRVAYPVMIAAAKRICGG